MLKRPLTALVLGGLLIGWSPILVRLSPVGPLATAFWRVGLACIPLLFALRQQNLKLPQTLDEHVAAAIPGVFLAADLAAWQTSLHLTSVANSTLLANMVPIFATIGGWLFWRQAVSRVFLASLALSIAGVIILRGGPAAAGGGHLAGDGLALGAAVFYAGYIVSAARARQKFPVTVVMVWSTAAAALCTLPLALAFENAFFPSTVAGFAVLLALAFVAHAAGHSLITWALAWLPPGFSSLTLLIQPIVAGILAWIILAEPLGGWQIAGGLTIIASIVIAKGAMHKSHN